jgi:hypothetical protein
MRIEAWLIVILRVEIQSLAIDFFLADGTHENFIIDHGKGKPAIAHFLIKDFHASALEISYGSGW